MVFPQDKCFKWSSGKTITPYGQDKTVTCMKNKLKRVYLKYFRVFIFFDIAFEHSSIAVEPAWGITAQNIWEFISVCICVNLQDKTISHLLSQLLQDQYWKLYNSMLYRIHALIPVNLTTNMIHIRNVIPDQLWWWIEYIPSSCLNINNLCLFQQPRI